MNDRAAMGSDAPGSVGTVGATNRTLVPITVMARIRLANSHSPVGADASSPIDPIDTGGSVTWLGEHERAKGHHGGNQRRVTSIEAQYSAFQFTGAFWMCRSPILFHRLRDNQMNFLYRPYWISETSKSSL